MPWDRFKHLRDGVLREDGYIASPFVIDAHTHIHLHVPKAGQTRFKDFFEVSEQLAQRDQCDFIDPKMLIREMDRYGVDKACVLCADMMYIPFDKFLEFIKSEPERFIGFFWPQYEEFDPTDFDNKKPPITPQSMADQVEEALNHPEIKGLGEGLVQGAVLFGERKGWPADDILRFMMPMLEVAASKKVPILWHSGPAPYTFTNEPSTRRYRRGGCGLEVMDPIIYDEIAALFPEIPMLIGHCGVQGTFYYGSYADHALMMASMHENVYLETSMAPADLIEKAIADPSIGAEKLVMGSDFGATSSYYVHKGKVLPSYKKRPFPELPGMHIEQMIRVLEEVTMTPEERRLIMGQNMARLLKI